MASCGSSTTEGASDVSPFHLFHSAYCMCRFLLCWFVLFACVFCWFCLCLVLCFACAAGIFLTVVADVSRWPTMLHRSFGCAKKKNKLILNLNQIIMIDKSWSLACAEKKTSHDQRSANHTASLLSGCLKCLSLLGILQVLALWTAFSTLMFGCGFPFPLSSSHFIVFVHLGPSSLDPSHSGCAPGSKFKIALA